MLVLGLFAVLATPREEEPQVDVTMANVLIPFPGASAADVETLVATPVEQVISQMPGLEHVFSVSQPGLALVTAQFKVGVPRIAALVRLYDTIQSNRDWMPAQLGVGEPLIKPKGIDDVPIVTFTLWTRDEARGAFDLERVAHAIEIELKRVPGTREVTTIGGPGRVVRVVLDPERLAAFMLSAADIRRMLVATNTASTSGALHADNRTVDVETGQYLANAQGRRVARRRGRERQPGLPVRCGGDRRRSSAAVALRVAGHRPAGVGQEPRFCAANSRPSPWP